MIIILLWIVIAYLAGAVPTGYLAGKFFKGIDIREHGSKNPGATNVFRVVGTTAGIITFIVDALKGFLPVYIAAKYFSFGQFFPIAVGLSAIAGHMWTIFLKFRGGKGVATGAGVFLALLPLPTLFALIIFAIVLFFTKYVSMGSIIAAFSLPVFAILLNKPKIHIFVSLIVAAAIILKHRSNIKKLIEGKEHKVGESKV